MSIEEVRKVDSIGIPYENQELVIQIISDHLARNAPGEEPFD